MCSNERPFCRNCINGGRQCEGYERERVFITGTLETKGRVASHPKKSSSTKKPKTKPDEAAKLPIRAIEPLMSAWDDRLRLSSHSAEGSVLLTALQTDLQAVQHEPHDGAAGFDICLPDYTPTELRPCEGQDDFNPRAKCLARLGGLDETCTSDPGYCAFLFQNSSTAHGTSWPQDNWVKSLGPKHFVSFPNHHYFVRLHRPLAVGFALLSRRASFLSEHEWIWTPWKHHAKSLLDELLDIALHIPSILGAVDNLVPLPATLARRLQAQGLLQSCLVMEAEFHHWLNKVLLSTADKQPAYWAESAGGGGEIPFENSYAFRDGLTGLMMLYYWMSQIIFHRCIESIHEVIFQPVVEDFPNMWPELPSALQIDLTHYQDGRSLAADICRGLDAVLMATTQPDLLLAPMTVALDFYRDINATCQDGVLEIYWLEAFKRRLSLKGQYIADVLQGQRWVQVASY
ncbi:hypothetical protein CDD81_7523 [Ophiocordyceps australis]|uniref:Zn(2)-C6 fungal-type domain-containing protein n=1 Tax=Ophiocordyceps australis TaxID=1399860 RepID=A0A2C5X8Z9_9HYPO|nr:hypothetical protein CDD81_7523 [Ophiocordyceps australis]